MHTEDTTMNTRAKKPQPGSSVRLLLALSALANVACSDAQEVAVRQTSSAVIYGSDNRVEAREYPHAARRTLAVLLLLFERLLGAGQLSSWGASAGEKFKVHLALLLGWTREAGHE